MLQLPGRVWNLDPTSRKGVWQGFCCWVAQLAYVIAVQKMLQRPKSRIEQRAAMTGAAEEWLPETLTRP